MSNPNFNPQYSTWDIWRAGEQTQCLDDDLIAIEADIATLESGKADWSHTHNAYATKAALTTLEDVVDTKADSAHAHTEYASSSHTHDEYALSSHTHTEFSSSIHNHDEDYASIDHTHDIYATTTALNELSTTVSSKANSSHTHIVSDVTGLQTALDGKAASGHTHSIVTTSVNGLMSTSDKIKLDGMVLATVSEVETYLAI